MIGGVHFWIQALHECNAREQKQTRIGCKMYLPLHPTALFPSTPHTHVSWEYIRSVAYVAIKSECGGGGEGEEPVASLGIFPRRIYYCRCCCDPHMISTIVSQKLACFRILGNFVILYLKTQVSRNCDLLF